VQSLKQSNGSAQHGEINDELVAAAFDDFLMAKDGLPPSEDIQELATKVISIFMQRLEVGAGVQVFGKSASTKNTGKVGRVIDRQGARTPAGRVRVRIGNEELLLSPEHLRVFPAASAKQLLSADEMSRQSEGVEVMFLPGSQVSVAGSEGEPSLVGARATVLRYNPSSGRYHVRLMDESGDLKTFWPFSLDPFTLDEAVVREIASISEPAFTYVCDLIHEDSGFPFSAFQDMAFRQVVQRLLKARLWLGCDALEELLAALLQLAEEPGAERAMQLWGERKAAAAASAADQAVLEARIARERQADRDLRCVLDKEEKLRKTLTPKMPFGLRARGTVVDIAKLRRKVGLDP